MTAFFDLVDRLPELPFYATIGGLLVACAFSERLALRRRS